MCACALRRDHFNCFLIPTESTLNTYCLINNHCIKVCFYLCNVTLTMKTKQILYNSIIGSFFNSRWFFLNLHCLFKKRKRNRAVGDVGAWVPKSDRTVTPNRGTYRTVTSGVPWPPLIDIDIHIQYTHTHTHTQTQTHTHYNTLRLKIHLHCSIWYNENKHGRKSEKV